MFDLFTPIDLAAFVYFFVAIVLYRYLCGPDALGKRSMPGAIQAQRVRWMANMAMRGEHRTMDVILLNNLAQGNAFFASTTALVVGGMAAVMGSGDKAQAALERLPYAAQASPILWELKLVTIIMMTPLKPHARIMRRARHGLPGFQRNMPTAACALSIMPSPCWPGFTTRSPSSSQRHGWSRSWPGAIISRAPSP
jgi:hypothetical protein